MLCVGSISLLEVWAPLRAGLYALTRSLFPPLALPLTIYKRVFLVSFFLFFFILTNKCFA